MESLLFDDLQVVDKPNNNYLVLARKYRPSNFNDVIGQDVLIKTFTNAIAAKRLAHAFLLTGIRGVGKTTTARIIAKALNCTGIDGKGSITINPCDQCSNCKSIKIDRHQDVIEVDAASHTGVNDIREIIENTKYRPVSARFKIFIIDEVHMLSTSAFNALLKTLEEPPSHVKFIFATTEIKKIPLTILSRCQRFDLKRVSVGELVKYFQQILERENLPSAPIDSLNIIASNAQGSVRDGLSILDQAISHTDGDLNTPAIRSMLGLSSNDDIFLLFGYVIKNETSLALEVINKLYFLGMDPLLMMQDFMNLTHIITKAKIDSRTLDLLPEFNQTQINQFLQIVDLSRLNRMWMVLVKGFDEMKLTFNTLISLEMIVIRLIHIANLPAPENIFTQLKKTDHNDTAKLPAQSVPRTLPNPSTSTAIGPYSFEEIEQLLSENDEVILGHYLRTDVRLISVGKNELVIRPLDRAPKNLNAMLKNALERITNETWSVINATGEGEPTLSAQNKVKDEQKIESIRNHPTVLNMLNSFTDLEIADIKINENT